MELSKRTRERMAKKPPTIDDYLSKLPADQQAALEKVRKAIRAAAPQAEECISYGVPAFRQGYALLSFGAAKQHCALYVMSPATMSAFADDLAKYDTSKGTIRFPPNKPLSATLIKKLVKARLAENAARHDKTKKKSGR